MENVIIILILVALVGAVIWYLRREKKKGKTCIGCPYAGECSKKCSEHKPQK